MLLCDGCDHVRHNVKSLDGRTLLCFRCRVKWYLYYRWKKE